jgi:hypothetical protein
MAAGGPDVSPENEFGCPTCRGYTWVFALWLVPQGAVLEFSFHAIQTIELKFTIDKYTQSMVPLRVLPRTNLARFALSTSSISFLSFRLRTLKLSCRSFSHPDPLFSITSALFLQNTRGGCPNTSAPSFASAVTCATWRLYPLYPHSIAHTSCHHGGVPLRELLRCTEAQKCLSVSPLLATLTHSVSRKSFPCHSYANTRGWGTERFPAKLRFRRHMRHVAPLSPVASLDCAYFPSPRGCVPRTAAAKAGTACCATTKDTARLASCPTCARGAGEWR